MRGPIISSMRVDVDLVGVGLDVDEHRHDAATAPAARCRSRTSSGDVITSSPGSQPSRSTASHNADVPELTITPCALGEQLGAAPLELRDPWPEVPQPRLEHLQHRVDLTLVVHRPGFGDTVSADLSHDASLPSPRRRRQLEQLTRHIQG